MKFRHVWTFPIIVFHFFWLEDFWPTQAFKILRLLRFLVLITPFIAVYFLIRGAGAQNYSHFEGKALESKVDDLKGDILDQKEIVRKLLLDLNTITLQNVKLQGQIDVMQRMIDDAKDLILNVVTAMLILGAGHLFWSVAQLKFRKEIGRKDNRSDSEH